MVIEPKNIGFIHIPKCGGASINLQLANFFNKRVVLADRNHPFIIQYVTPANTLHVYPHFTYDEAWTQFPNIRYVTQVRNPLDRWESLYKHYYQRNSIKTWDIETWTENAMKSLKNACLYGIFENKIQYEHRSAFWDQSKMFLPAWMYYRQPEVEVHKLEEQTIWKALDIPPCHVHKSRTVLIDYDREKVKDIIYDYYKKDFEYYGG